jgi:hypothetical protein
MIELSERLAAASSSRQPARRGRGSPYGTGLPAAGRSDGTRLRSSEGAVEPLTVSSDGLDNPVINPPPMMNISLETWTKVNLAIEHRHLLSTHF